MSFIRISGVYKNGGITGIVNLVEYHDNLVSLGESIKKYRKGYTIRTFEINTFIDLIISKKNGTRL